MRCMYMTANIICDRFAGPECAPGFMGAECTEPCPKGRYGRNCDKFCSCSPSKICNRVTGELEILDYSHNFFFDLSFCF